MILVCAAGLTGSNADDVAKELAIYRAHKAAAIAIVSEDDDRYGAAAEIDPGAARAPELRVRAERDGRSPLRLRGRARDRRVGAPAARGAGRGGGRRRSPPSSRRSPSGSPSRPRGSSPASGPASTTARSRPATAVRLASVLRYAAGIVPLDVYSAEHGTLGTPAVVAADLTVELTKAIEELTRPGRRDQAPGQDGHRRHLACRRDAAAGAARARGARRRRAARRAHLQGAADARGPRSCGRRGQRAGPATASRATRSRRRRRSASSTAAASRARCAPAPRTTRACAARSRPWRPSGRCS